jgi:hypothetical protein
MAYQNGLVALDPFVIGSGGETVDDDHYQFRLVDAGCIRSFGNVMDICVRQGRLHIVTYRSWEVDLMVWELTDDDHLGSALKTVSKHPQPPEVSQQPSHCVIRLTLYPNDVDIIYFKVRSTGCYIIHDGIYLAHGNTLQIRHWYRKVRKSSCVR